MNSDFQILQFVKNYDWKLLIQYFVVHTKKIKKNTGPIERSYEGLTTEKKSQNVVMHNSRVYMRAFFGPFWVYGI